MLIGNKCDKEDMRCVEKREGEKVISVELRLIIITIRAFNNYITGT